jgi:hypothetical protein
MVEGITPRTGDEQGDEAAEVNEGHFAVPLADETSAMDDKKRHGHGDDQGDKSKARGQTDDQQEGAKDFRENHEVEAHGRTDPERIGKRARFVSHALHFAPTVEQKHRKAQPDPEDQQTDILEPLAGGTDDPLRVRFDHALKPIRTTLERRRK